MRDNTASFTFQWAIPPEVILYTKEFPKTWDSILRDTRVIFVCNLSYSLCFKWCFDIPSLIPELWMLLKEPICWCHLLHMSKYLIDYTDNRWHGWTGCFKKHLNLRNPAWNTKVRAHFILQHRKGKNYIEWKYWKSCVFEI